MIYNRCQIEENRERETEREVEREKSTQNAQKEIEEERRKFIQPNAELTML